MSAPMAFLKSRFHPILPEVEAELEKIRERILIVCVDGHPVRALGGGVDGVEADGDFAFEVTADCVQRQAEPLAGFLWDGSCNAGHFPGAAGWTGRCKLAGSQRGGSSPPPNWRALSDEASAFSPP